MFRRYRNYKHINFLDVYFRVDKCFTLSDRYKLKISWFNADVFLGQENIKLYMKDANKYYET